MHHDLAGTNSSTINIIDEWPFQKEKEKGKEKKEKEKVDRDEEGYLLPALLLNIWYAG